MRALASFAMKGRTPAALVIAGFAVLSLVLPPLGLLSAAALALVTMRLGADQGLWLMMFGAVLIGVVAYFTVNTVAPAIVFALVLWAPVWGMGWVLRRTQSLALTLWLSAVLAMAGVLIFHLLVSDPAVWWNAVLGDLFTPVIEQSAMPNEQKALLGSMLAEAAPYMTGLLAAGVMINALTCLFIGRYWQAQLYNPGGFRQEFHQMRLGKQPALVAAVVAGIALLPLFGGLSAAAADVLVVVLTLFVLQGLAIVHAITALRKMHIAWLVGLYVLLFVAMAQMAVLLAAIGFLDSWIDIRRRLAVDHPG